MYMTPWARRAAARTLPGVGTPKVVHARSTDDDVQLLVAEGPGDGPEEQGELELAEGSVLPEAFQGGREATAVEIAVWQARWQEAVASGHGRDALVPLVRAAPDYGPGELRGPTPLAEELRQDRDLLLAANGRLAARVRALEAQLRGHGIEPVGRE